MTTTEIATTAGSELAGSRAATRSAIELAADQREFTPQQVAALKQLGLDDVPAAQLDLFFHRCQTTGLDPFARQIYLIGRKTQVGGYNGEPKREEIKYTIQTGIDGYRLNGRRAAKAAGEPVRTEGPFWMGPDGGGWSDVWLGGRGKPPAAAKFVIIADGEPHVGIALYTEFVQTKYNGDPNSMWAKMPANQLAKCAEAQAWRKAYPDDFSGLNLEDAVQVIDLDGAPVRATAERVYRSAADVLTAIEGADAVEEAQPVAEPTPPAEDNPPPVDPPMTKVQQRKVERLLGERGITDNAPILAVIGAFLGREITGPADVTRGDAIALLAHLEDDPVASEAQRERLSALLDENGLAEDAAAEERWQFLSVKAGRPIANLAHLTGREVDAIEALINGTGDAQ